MITRDMAELKVGELVRNSMKKLAFSNQLPPDIVSTLCDERHSKEVFDINYAFLKKLNASKNLTDQRLINGYARYWAKPITINGDKYFMCNDWYDRNKTRFIKWVNRIGE
ncbi:hypothetical protein NC661_04475 [Aquibacillus koreensis]|uniref:Uncharacterized protein n=1 Tax=Aquibacillus koreensis TaxID=279446 RepID=A0A9X4AHE1_9BACI|nr:hypothetical protein [Aquibacillus koreensis]MCT2534770.1 hypothetical protein [Aquibacillus koreensis]MDC3419619.1 hypothetical protein [Aquibacillus koreensis]